MKSANSVTTARPLRTSGIDLVRLAIELAGVTQIDEVLRRSLDLLRADQPEMAWAILQRIGPGKYRAAAGPGVTHQDLRDLSEMNCGHDNWLSLETHLSLRSSLGRPVVCAMSSGDCGPSADPDLVLARWAPPGIKPDPAGTELENAAKLIASAAGSAAVFEYLLKQNCHDPLTGLLNRTGILELMDREAARSQRSASELSVLFLDLDGFKEVNDRWGHAVGDGVLRQIAGVLSVGLRASDAVGRIGGDEFLVVLPETDLRAARIIGRRLSQAVESASGRPMGLSFGAASLDEVDHPSNLVEKADQRMLSQKRRRQVKTPDRLRDRGNSVVRPSAKAGDRTVP